ncbi:MAG: ribonucleoside-triphosphate reductase, adenosylcobalamin-dependent, partial [Cyanobacteriota bacterium]
MVRELARKQSTNFPETAPVANPVFFRTYSRRKDQGRETWEEVRDRCVSGLVKLGQLNREEAQLLEKTMTQLKSLPAGRWLWVGGTQWLENPKNYSGAYNCTSTNVDDWRAFGLMMDLAMMGCGTGAVLEEKYISQLPTIRNSLQVSVRGDLGTVLPEARQEETTVKITSPQTVKICIGDSRQGWVQSYQALLEIASQENLAQEINVEIDPSHVRPAGERLKGFGGVANPIKIPELYPRLAKILNKAQGRKLNAEECCLLIDEAAATVVAGNIRRSAGIRQFDADSPLLKQNLWQPDENGNWHIDPERDALRMANHTRVYHRKPSLEDCVEAVRSQFYSGEGAIQYAPEAIARGNADLLSNFELKQKFIKAYEQGNGETFLRQCTSTPIGEQEMQHRMERYGLNPCGEIIGSQFHCNLSEIHLNLIDPDNEQEQKEAFQAGALSVAALLNHEFVEPRYQYSRELDPIVGVSFTGLFDFFVHAFGVEWLRWWEKGRPNTPQGQIFKHKEQAYLEKWRQIV